jgi:hypothetical protein
MGILYLVVCFDPEEKKWGKRRYVSSKPVRKCEKYKKKQKIFNC